MNKRYTNRNRRKISDYFPELPGIFSRKDEAFRTVSKAVSDVHRLSMRKLGEDATREVFAFYARRRRTAFEARFIKQRALVSTLMEMDPPNINELARTIAADKGADWQVVKRRIEDALAAVRGFQEISDECIINVWGKPRKGEYDGVEPEEEEPGMWAYPERLGDYGIRYTRTYSLEEHGPLLG
jgi:hypothetical protein